MPDSQRTISHIRKWRPCQDFYHREEWQLQKKKRQLWRVNWKKTFKLAESLNKSTDAIIEQGEERKIARQKKNLMEKTEKIHKIKELLREVKITAETDEQETGAAINEIEERAEVFEDATDELDLKLIKIQAEAKRRAREEEMALERAYEQEKMDCEYRQREKKRGNDLEGKQNMRMNNWKKG